MAHVHEDPVVVARETTVITDGDGPNNGFGAGMIVAALAILAAVVVGLAVLFTQPWDDDGNTSPSVPDTSDSVPNVPDVPDAPNVPDVPDAPNAPDGGDVPAP